MLDALEMWWSKVKLGGFMNDEILYSHVEHAYELGGATEREACAAKAREFAAHYPQSSDGRNTFVLLAEWIDNRSK